MKEQSGPLRAFSHLELGRERLLKLLNDLPDRILEQRPVQGSWSVAQVIMHLAMAEEHALAYMKKKLHYGGLVPIRGLGQLRLSVLRLAFILPIRWKAPGPIADVPVATWPNALERWSNVRIAMYRALAALPAGSENHDLFKHPAVGKMSLDQGVRFMRIHMEHHRKQIRRILYMLADRSSA